VHLASNFSLRVLSEALNSRYLKVIIWPVSLYGSQALLFNL